MKQDYFCNNKCVGRGTYYCPIPSCIYIEVDREEESDELDEYGEEIKEELL
jgi:hypothetical protein